jgi:hypothetical protein
MTRLLFLLGSWLAVSPAPQGAVAVPADTQPSSTAVKTAFDEDPPPRLSLPTESDRALWKKPGFRFSVGFAYGRLYGVGGPPNYAMVGPLIRAGLRLDEAWSLMGSLQYFYATGGGVGSTLRYAGTVEPTWHATEHLSLAVGIGFGGIIESRSRPTNPDPQPSTLDSSYTFPNAKTPIPSCNGVGAAGLLRAQWMWVMGPRSSTGLSLEFAGQWTACEEDTGNFEPDTATPVVRRQWWPHLGGSLTWEIQWR